MKNIVPVFILICFLNACVREGPKNNDYHYNTGIFPDTPVNFEKVNTQYDDYNATAPFLGETFPLCFSSNRNSNGGQFNIVFKLVSIYFSKYDGTLDISTNVSSNLSVYIENQNINFALSKINTPQDELGPLLIQQGKVSNSTNINGRYNSYILLYSSSEEGNQNIMFTENLEKETYTEPIKVDFLNTNADDAYPTYHFGNSQIYFTSNREDNFNIYKVITDSSKELKEQLLDTTISNIEKENILNSLKDDKCPFISFDFMVFTSNRDGGYGGYDLYYSRYENGNWSDPENFGDKINTEFDEYRPIVRPQSSFENDFMLFSSNRPGGKGGFDLYYVGIDKNL